MTSYRPTPSQTRPECRDRINCDTAEGDGVTKHGIAASRDLLSSGRLKYGDIVCMDGFGCRVVNDKMGPKAKRSIDLMVFTKDQERHVGTRHLKVYKLEVQQ